MHLESSSQRAGSLALTREWSGEGRGSSIFGEGALETRAILKFGLGRNSTRVRPGNDLLTLMNYFTCIDGDSTVAARWGASWGFRSNTMR